MKKYIGFWKPWGDYGFLSQWYKCSFKDSLHTYNCAEQYMMAQKAILFEDFDILEEILKEDDPSKIKNYGRKIKNFNQSIWDMHKEDIVYEGNYLKFSQNANLTSKLLDTGNAILVEASPYDKIWGVGTEDYNDEAKWNGLNLLGSILCDVRETIQYKLE